MSSIKKYKIRDQCLRKLSKKLLKLLRVLGGNLLLPQPPWWVCSNGLTADVTFWGCWYSYSILMAVSVGICLMYDRQLSHKLLNYRTITHDMPLWKTVSELLCPNEDALPYIYDIWNRFAAASSSRSSTQMTKNRQRCKRKQNRSFLYFLLTWLVLKPLTNKTKKVKQ